jgi:hypothetical protein
MAGTGAALGMGGTGAAVTPGGAGAGGTVLIGCGGEDPSFPAWMRCTAAVTSATSATACHCGSPCAAM